MPIYDYHCDHCGHSFSAVQSFKDEALGSCPSCGKKPRRLITSPAIVFKGSGWYKTDSRAAARAKDSSAEKDGSKTETKTEAKPEGKSETTTEAKTDTKPDTAAAKSGEAAS